MIRNNKYIKESNLFDLVKNKINYDIIEEQIAQVLYDYSVSVNKNFDENDLNKVKNMVCDNINRKINMKSLMFWFKK